MRSLMDDVEIERDAGGTRVRMERDVAFGPAEEHEQKAAAVTFGDVRGVTVAIVEGEVDLAVAERVAAELEAAPRTDGSGLVVDLSGVSYLDSSGVHLLFKLANRRHSNRRHHANRRAGRPGAARARAHGRRGHDRAGRQRGRGCRAALVVA